MMTTSTPAEQRTILENISWQTFEALLQETGDQRGYRFVYERGLLEIMTPLFEHENSKIQLDRFILAKAEEMGIEIKSAGSMTLKRRDAQRGIEPDNCYFIQSLPVGINQRNLNLESDLPPDLAIEIDITSSSVDKLGIYAILGVPEIW